MDIEQIKMLCKDVTIEVTQHILVRCQQRHITYEEIKEVIYKGEIMRKCFYCKENMVDDFSNYMVDLDGRFIIVRNVPCHKCSQTPCVSRNHNERTEKK